MRRGFSRAGAILTLTLLAATLCGEAAASSWFFDLAVHFRVQYAALGVAAFVLLLLMRSPGWALLALTVSAYNAMYAAPVLSTHPAPLPKLVGEPVTGAPIRLRVMAINVLYSNGDYARLREYIRRERPDVVTLSEMDAGWRQSLRDLEREFPHRYQTVGTRGHGITFWSRHPLRGASVLPIGVRAEPAIRAVVEVNGRELEVYSVHTSWPMTPAAARERNAQLAQLAARARAQTLPLVVVGDLNVSPFSPHFERLRADGGLRSAADGFGWQPTWPTFFPPAGIQIDHALVNSRVGVEQFRVGPEIGSDHRPIVVDVAF